MDLCNKCEKKAECTELCTSARQLVTKGERIWRRGKQRKMLIWDMSNVPHPDTLTTRHDRVVVDMSKVKLTPRQQLILDLLLLRVKKQSIMSLLGISRWVVNFEIRRIKQAVDLARV
jgi:DNA-binding CsgD family transcriptional regulator